MALVNCTINSQSLTKTAGAQIGSDNAQLVITPNDGFVVTAGDFTNNTGVLSGVSSISLSDSGTPGTIGNTVLVSVDLDDTFTMPSSDTNIVIDIDGSAQLAQFSLTGNYNILQENTTSSNGNTSYTATGNYNQTVSVFTKTITASANYYFKNLPYYYIDSNYENNYTVTEVNTTDSNGNVTAVTFTVTFLMPNENVSGDTIYFVANASPLTIVLEEIYSYAIATANIPSNGVIRTLELLGNPNADFNITIETNNGVAPFNTYDFTTNEFTSDVTSLGASVMPAQGFVAYDIFFPPSVADVYKITLSGDLNLPAAKPNPFTISQYGDIDITVGIDSIDGTLFLRQDQIITTRAGQNNSFNKTLSFEVFTDPSLNNPQLLYIGNQPNISDWVISALDGSDIEVLSTSITGNGTNTLTVTVELGIIETGTSNVNISLDIDPYFNTPPVAVADSASVNKGDDVTIDVLSNDSDADGDSLSITIVSNPTAGTVATNASNQLVYTHDDSNTLADSFTYKISDGFNFSNIVTVTIGIGVLPGESINASGAVGVYLVPIVLGTEAGTYKVHFNAASVPDRVQILFDSAGISNNLADMEIQADSLFVGGDTSPADSLVTNNSITNPFVDNIINNDYDSTTTVHTLDEFLYNGSSFDATNNTVSIDFTAADIADNSANRSDAVPNGQGQIGVQNLVYTSISDTTGTSNLNYADGNICITFTKTATTAFNGYIRVYGMTLPGSITSWRIFQTEFVTS